MVHFMCAPTDEVDWRAEDGRAGISRQHKRSRRIDLENILKFSLVDDILIFFDNECFTPFINTLNPIHPNFLVLTKRQKITVDIFDILLTRCPEGKLQRNVCCKATWGGR